MKGTTRDIIATTECYIFEQFQTISSHEMSRSKLIPWMPTLVVTRQIYLGRHEQAEERSVVEGLEVTHVLSIGRFVVHTRTSKYSVVYLVGWLGWVGLTLIYDVPIIPSHSCPPAHPFLPISHPPMQNLA